MRGSTYTSLQWRILLVITAMNFINYVDRQCIVPLLGPIKAEFHVTDFQLGLLGTVFMIVHSLAIIPFGIWTDHWNRTRIVSIGAFFWSLATLASGLAGSFRALLGARAAVGIGESAYTPAAASMISDAFPQEERARVQSYYNAGMFAGGTLGMALAGYIGSRLGWRMAFYLVALPGILLALYSWRTPDPPRRTTASLDVLGSLRVLWKITAYHWVLIGGVLVIFSSGAFIFWGIEFAIRYYGMTQTHAAVLLASTILVAGLLGVLSGGWVADWLQKRWICGRVVTIGAAFLLAVPFLVMALYAPGRGSLMVMLFIASYFLCVYHGPATAVIHDITPDTMHGRSYALYIFMTHMIGDVAAPAVVGRIADVAGLRQGLLLAAGTNLAGGVAFLIAAFYIWRRRLGPSDRTSEPELDSIAPTR